MVEISFGRLSKIWWCVLVALVLLYLLFEDGTLQTLPYLVLPVAWLISKRVKYRPTVTASAVVVFFGLILTASPQARQAVFNPSDMVSVAGQTPAQIAAAADKTPLDPTMQVLAADNNPGNSTLATLALLEAPESQLTWVAMSAQPAGGSPVPANLPGWEGLYLGNSDLIHVLGAYYSQKGGLSSDQPATLTLPGYYHVAGRLLGMVYAAQPSDLVAAQAAQAYAMAGDQATAEKYAKAITNKDLAAKAERFVERVAPPPINELRPPN